MRGEAGGPEEIVIERPDGERRTALSYALPIRDENGKVTGAVAVNFDVAPLREAQDALRGWPAR